LRHRKRKKTERILALVALSLIALAWIVGAVRAESDLMPAVQRSFPEADHFERLDDGLYAAIKDGAVESPVGYVTIGVADGYGGPLTMAVAVDPSGVIIGVEIADHKETASWMRLVLNTDSMEKLVGKSYSDPFTVGIDVDGVTGATYTIMAMAEATLDGGNAAARHMARPVTPPPPPKIKFGIPEIVLLALFAVGYIAHQRGFKYKKPARWGSMLVGMVVLGFIYNSPVTLAYITKLILGYWPQWQTNLYWYFLIGGMLFVFTVDKKNPYCEWFCPFGAVQECMGIIGGAKPRKPRRFYELLKWLQRALALAAVLLGVFFRSPGLASFEIFGTLFSLVGTSVQFVALGLVLITSLFIKRPWCNYLCPVFPVVDLILVCREWVKEQWQKINPIKKSV
jgi:hypothetical protein